MLKKILMFIIAMVLAAGAAYAAPADLPETGQTTCYDASGGAIACANTGQDGELKAGVAWPSPRFTDNSNGTITDNLTGLIWLKNARCFGESTWAAALNYANNLENGQCGLTDGSSAGDWRLPNVNELESLINAEKAHTGMWLEAQGFTVAHYYWSSSTCAVDAPFDTNFAWYVDMIDGSVLINLKTVSILYYVWPVRGGQ